MTAVSVGSPQRLLGPPPAGPAPHLPVSALVALLDDAGLTGRGGAGFPTATKLAALAGRAPVVVGNAMEGEPLSRKDAVLLRRSPGLVVDGLEVVSAALGARRTVLAVGHHIAPSSVRAEVGSRGSRVEVLHLSGGFVAGQESALVRRVDGGPGVPGDPLVPVRERGVGGRPTLVLNAETLAQVALLARHGAGWFRSVGTPDDPGTSLVSVSASSEAPLARPGVLEVARGAALADVLERAEVRLGRVRAVLVGGYHGAWVPLSASFDRASLAAYGASPGAGVVHVLDHGTCPLRATAAMTAYLARESAGQCGPCVNGLPRMADTLARLADGPADAALVPEVARLAALVTGRGACRHPDGTARLVASTMRTFADHVDAHLEGRCLL